MNSDFNDHSCALLTAFLHTYWHADFIDHNCALLTAFFLLHLLYWSQFRFTDRIFVHLLTCWLPIRFTGRIFCTLTNYWPADFTDRNSAFFVHLLTAFLCTDWPAGFYWSQFRFTDRFFLYTYWPTLHLLILIFQLFQLEHCWIKATCGCKLQNKT